jgi:hypothetical protein
MAHGLHTEDNCGLLSHYGQNWTSSTTVSAGLPYQIKKKINSTVQVPTPSSGWTHGLEDMIIYKELNI